MAVSDLWELRTGKRQQVEVDVQAAAASLVSFAFLRGEQPSNDLMRDAGPITALFPAKEGAWIHLHGGFPHLREGLQEILGCENTPDSIGRAVAGWDAQELEDEIAARRLCGARVRTEEEWRAHPQGQALAAKPLVELRRVGDAPPEPLPPGARPLSGLRVLDLTRVLAGPTCARTLAEHGADVLRVHAPHLPTIPPFVLDTSHGKLCTELDLRDAGQADRFRALVRDGDVVSRGYRAGALDKLGFGLEELVALRPGLIAVAINCYGHTGPWAERAGWEQLAQTAIGIVREEGGEETPRLLPAAATDYTTGYLAALGTLVALHRRATEGGSWEVRVSLARTGMWLQDLPRVQGTPSLFDDEALAPWFATTETSYGPVRHLAPVLGLSETPPVWSRPTPPLGAHAPVWPDRE